MHLSWSHRPEAFPLFKYLPEQMLRNRRLRLKTASSITLKTEDGYEYARQTVDDAGNKEWKWAKSDQYSTEKKTVSFTGLDVGTEYVFACRQKDVDGAELGTVTVSTAAAETEAPKETQKQTETAKQTEPETEETVKQTEPETEETVKQTEPETEETVKQTEPETEETVKQTEPETEETVKQTEPETEETKQTETTPPETKPADSQLPQTTDVKSPAENGFLSSSGNPKNSSDDTKNGTDTTDTTSTNPTTDPNNSTTSMAPPTPKAPTAPAAPELESRTDTEIHLKAVDQQEYALVPADNTSYVWQSDSVFTGLEAGKEYSFVTRVKASGNGSVPAGDISAPALFKTKTAAASRSGRTGGGSCNRNVNSVKSASESGNSALLTANGPEKWNTTGTFDNLQPGTEYAFITRMVYDENEAMPSQNSAELKTSTKATVPAAPAAPVMESRTDTEIRLKGADQQQYALVPADGTTYQWQDSPIFAGLQAGTEYSFVTRIKENGNVPASAISQPVKVKTKLAAAAAPAAPELQDRGEGSVTLKAGTNLEYGIGTGDGTWKWQDSPEFMGLQPGTRYKFAARVKFDSESAVDSQISAPARYKTIISSSGIAVQGVTNDGVYDFNTKLTATAIGVGMDNKNPANGDTRWVPRSWNWDGKNNRTWNSAPYSVTFTLDKAGQYVLTVNYEAEEICGRRLEGHWKR